MKVLVETPKYSFHKYSFDEDSGSFHLDFTSPFPSLFNYGCLQDTRAEDGMPRDVVVFGPKRKQGDVVDAEQVGLAYFEDAGVPDNKIIAVERGGFNPFRTLKIRAFLHVYALFKTIRYLLVEHRLVRCRFLGLRRKG